MENEASISSSNATPLSIDNVTPDDVLTFWFGEIQKHEDAIDGAMIRKWFTSNKDFDDLIRTKYGEIMEGVLVSKALEEWRSSPKGLLALIIIADQFTRNVHRNTPGMFEHDPFARKLCKEGMEKGFDWKLFQMHPIYAQFFYMPLMHSTEYSDHEVLISKSRECIEKLDDKHPSHAMTTIMWPKYIDQHADVIKQCGRYPQRNKMLGRETTEKEQELIEKYNLMDLIDKK